MIVAVLRLARPRNADTRREVFGLPLGQVTAEAAVDFNFPAGAVYARLDPTGGYDFELSDLGAAGLSSRWEASLASIPELDVTMQGRSRGRWVLSPRPNGPWP